MPEGINLDCPHKLSESSNEDKTKDDKIHELEKLLSEKQTENDALWSQIKVLQPPQSVKATQTIKIVENRTPAIDVLSSEASNPLTNDDATTQSKVVT